MGFECGFETVPKVKDISAERYLYIEANKHYIEGAWLQEHYTDFEEYFKENYRLFDRSIECKYPDNGFLLNSYKDIKPKSIEWWCSIGRRLDDDYVQGQLEQIKPFEHYEVTKEWVEQSLEAVKKSLAEEELIPCTAIYSFTYNDDGDKVLKLCDGLLTEDENGNQALIDFEYDNIWIAPRYFDSDYHYAKIRFRNILEELKNIDFETNFVFYYRSY